MIRMNYFIFDHILNIFTPDQMLTLLKKNMSNGELSKKTKILHPLPMMKPVIEIKGDELNRIR